jgi:transcription-repair coupling factor (superfamily II helicase)
LKISGLPSDGAKAFYLFENFVLKDRPVIFITSSDEDVEIACENAASAALYFKSNFPASKILRFSFDRFDKVRALVALAQSDGAFFMAATPESVSSGVIPRGGIRPFRLTRLEESLRYELIDYLSRAGYERVDFVEDFGDFAVRGEIVDFWSAGSASPVRVVFAGDTVESLRTFEVESQRTSGLLEYADVPPASMYDVSGTIENYLPENTAVVTDEGVVESSLPWLTSRKGLYAIDPLEGENTGYSKTGSFSGNSELFTRAVERFRADDYRITVFCSNYGEQERLLEIIGGKAEVIVSPLSQGFVHQEKHEAVFAYNDIFGRTRRPSRIPRFKSGKILEGLWEITAGDYVVHERYGIGGYRGLRQIPLSGSVEEFLFLEYRGGDKLYVPVSDFRKVQKYIGIEGRPPRLFSMDSPSWEKVKLRAKESASGLAKQLYELYAARKNSPGRVWRGDALLERTLGESFIYEETPDQRRAIEEVINDMQSPSPMDRLVLGDVGFGKTEVAVRAAFRSALSGAQTALLCPTTILAEQHYDVLSRRLAPFAVNIALLTRFRTRQQQKKILDNLKKGLVDVIIGTHRLLQKDVSFKNLGLLIIDEEHRFGVKQKEQIKMFRKDLDVLSLTATPIPRTLSMSLSGMKDLSLIESPPEGRLEIETHISAYSDETVKKTILAEIVRSGQVFYVHNYVFSIRARLKHLEGLLPGIRFAVVHGQMPSRQIEKTMLEFSHGKVDCLISTTIIESGLDLPNVNTMIVESAEEFGLAQLYQLRGRIGRGRLKAYCYLFYSPEEMTQEAKKRLAALREFTKVGSGMRLALRDMEIRGAGEILGGKQHGFVRDVGLELYSKYLSDEMGRLKGAAAYTPTTAPAKEPPVIELKIPAYIPDDYVKQDELRITFYRKFIAAEKPSELNDILEELEDRFGKPPEPVENLAGVVELRWLAEKAGVSKILQKDECYEITFGEETKAQGMVDYLLKHRANEIRFTKTGFILLGAPAIASTAGGSSFPRLKQLLSQMGQ